MKKTIIFFIIVMFHLHSFCQNGLSSFHLPLGFSSGQLLRSDLSIDNQDNKWVAFRFNGLWKLSDTMWSGYTTANSGISSNNVNSIYIYHDTIYCGTDNGVSVFNGTSWVNYDTSNGLLGLVVNGIFYDGNKIYARINDVLSVFDGNVWSNYPLGYPVVPLTITKFVKDNMAIFLLVPLQGVY